jgi:glutamate--cysteine ligase
MNKFNGLERWTRKLCRIGTEHEKFGFYLDTLKPLEYKQIAQLLNGMAERFNWEKVMENGNIIGLKMVSQSFVSS